MGHDQYTTIKWHGNCSQVHEFDVVEYVRGPGSIPGTTKKKVVGLEHGPLSLVSTTEELLDRKVAAPV
jgi:hypothetical protein